MKNINVFLALVAMVSSIAVNTAFALPIPTLNCQYLNNCAVYVNDNAAVGGDGTISKPFQKITDAVNFVKSGVNPDYNTIYVAGGTYNKETFPWVFDAATYTKGIKMYGGYDAAFAVNSPSDFKTFIQANGANQVLNIVSQAGAVEGFDISGVNNGSILTIDNEGATNYAFSLKNNTFHDSVASASVPILAFLTSGSNTGTVNNSTFYNNTANSTLIANFHGNINVTKNRFYANNAATVLKFSLGAFVANNYLLGNTANWVVNPAGSSSFYNNTVARNTINSGSDNAAVLLTGNSNEVANNLITNNLGNISLQHSNGDSSAVVYNAFFGNSSDPLPFTNSNLSCDPLYVTGNGVLPADYKIGTGSACIDKGKTLANVTDDYFGNSRPWDGNGDGVVALDPGAFEGHFNVGPPPGSCSGFIDVPASDANCAAVTYVKNIGAMTGNPDGTFAPNASLQRDQVTKIVLETFKKFNIGINYCNGVNPFPDVTSFDWSYQYVCGAKQIGIATGYKAAPDTGYFRPARVVSRAEFLAFLLRNLNESMPTISSVSYQDVAVNQWFSGYAKYSLDHNLFSGPNLYPAAATKRVEVAEVIFRLHQLGKI